jgi:hypothetical protein
MQTNFVVLLSLDIFFIRPNISYKSKEQRHYTAASFTYFKYDMSATPSHIYKFIFYATGVRENQTKRKIY